jgi:glycosyltransferase involved in cell wall biosynthesis
MSGLDISIVLTLHREGKYLPRTLMSLSEAAVFATRAGLSLECVAVFDKSDALTRGAFACTRLEGLAAVQTIDAENGCVSRSRNDGCAAVRGKYTFILDGDDLISYSIFPRMLRDAERFGPKTILTPKFLFGFGRSFFSVEYFDSDDIHAEDMVFQHLFNSRIFAHNTLFRSLSYEPVAHRGGHAFEDWHFNCQAMARGYSFRTVEQTAWFYRQRLDSRNHEAEAITTRQILPSELFDPAVFLRTCPAAAPRSAPSPSVPRGGKVLNDPVYVDLLAHANRIDPSLFIGNYHWRSIGHFNNLTNGSIGGAYRFVCEIVGTARFGAIFFLSSDRTVPAPVLERMVSLATERPRQKVAAWFNGEGAAHNSLEEMPPAVHALDFGRMFPYLEATARDVLCLKLLEACGGTASLHFVASSFAHRFFSRFKAVLGGRSTTYYRSPCEIQLDGGEAFRESESFQFISEYIDDLDEIVPLDSESTVFDQRRFRYGARKYRDPLRSADVPVVAD